MATKKPKQTVNATIRPNEADWKLIGELRAKTGLNITGLIRLALRRLADSEGVKAA